MSAVSGIGLGKQSPHAAWRWIVRAIAAAAVLLVAALAAAPAGAEDTAIVSPLSAGSAAPPDNGQATATAPQSNSATSTQTATATGGAGGTATGGSAGPSQGGSGSSQGGSTYANGGDAESHNSVENKQSNQNSYGSGRSGSGMYDSGGGDTFVVETPKKQGSDRAAARKSHARSPKRFGPTTAGRSTPFEAKTPSGHETGNASPSNAALPGHGGQLPGQNPFFNLLSGSGGAGTGLVLLLLAVLGASIALPRQHFKAFRAPAGPWRPLAYVPPIELPG